MFNNTTHRPATIQRIRIGATKDGKITAIGHEGWSGDLPGGGPETAVGQTRLLYAGANRMTKTRLAVLDLPEGNAMRAPGEAPGLMALEIAIDEMAEKLGLDPIEFRIRNDTQVDPEKPQRPFSQRQLVQCLRTGADKFGWSKRGAPGQTARRPLAGRHGRGRGLPQQHRHEVGARVRLDKTGLVTVETDMTDIGTGTYTIIAQTAAEMMGVPLNRVGASGRLAVPGLGRLGRSMGRQQLHGRRLCRLRQATRGRGQQAGHGSGQAQFVDGRVTADGRSVPLAQAAATGAWWPRTRWNMATWPRPTSNRPSAATSSRSASTPPPAKSASAACWRSAPPAGSSIRNRLAAR
jgi:xanthine dehydrogenase YagR molybdenum-binding subunit